MPDGSRAAEFLDASIVIRYLTQDSLEQSAQAWRILQNVEADRRRVTTTESIVMEVVFVLASKALYNLPREEIRRHVGNVISLRSLKLAHKRTVLAALDLFVERPNLSFVDALSVAHMQRLKLGTILSIDRDFDRVERLTRKEG